MWLEMESYVYAMADARAGPTACAEARSQEGGEQPNLGGIQVRWTNRCDWALASPPTHCANPSPGGRAKSLRGENIRKNWVYTPAGWKSQLVIRRKSLYHGITNLDLSPAERWGAMERPALKLERVQ